MSSTKSAKEPIVKEDLAKIRQLIELIENEPQAYDFLEPVDYIGKFYRILNKNLKQTRLGIGRLPNNYKESYGYFNHQSK